jgi:hypothetical protein
MRWDGASCADDLIASKQCGGKADDELFLQSGNNQHTSASWNSWTSMRVPERTNEPSERRPNMERTNESLERDPVEAPELRSIDIQIVLFHQAMDVIAINSRFGGRS